MQHDEVIWQVKCATRQHTIGVVSIVFKLAAHSFPSGANRDS